MQSALRGSTAMFLFFVGISPLWPVSAIELHQTVSFNIPRQGADLSLINFAEQVDITLLFLIEKLKINKKINCSVNTQLSSP